jgi:hypothetical protein
MKIYSVVLLALLVNQGFAQAAPAQPNAAAPSRPVVAEAKQPVGPDTPVISVAGVCKMAGAKAGDCKTVITRSEFERLMTVLSRQRNGEARQSIPAEAKQQLAIQYSRLLLFGDLAEKQGLQNTDEGKELIHFLRLQALTEELARNIQQKAAVTPEEIQSYYDRNPERNSEWHLQRIVVPRNAGGGNQLNEEALKALGGERRQRASSGGDFDSLQKEAFEKVGTKNPPAAKLVLTPGTLLPEAHSAVYRLKPGEVSQVIEDADGFYIYKLDSSKLVPLDKSKAEIREFLAGQKAQQAIQGLLETNKVTLNSDYFEPSQGSAPKTSSAKPVGGAVRAQIQAR